MKTKAPAKAPVHTDAGYTQAVQNYESGLKALQERKFERAKGFFEKVLSGSAPELADRARVHLNTCNTHMAQTSTSFNSPEEQFDYAVSLMNTGNYDDARAQVEQVLKRVPRADYALYGLAAIDCLTQRPDECMRHLSEAIKLNPIHRVHARNDSDFDKISDDPRFTELLYPEPGSEA